jgi:AraC-like DNA-binding protein
VGAACLHKIIFDAAQLPGTDQVRKEAWIETLASSVARVSIDPVPGIPFEGNLEILPLARGAVGTVAATFQRATRDAADIAANGSNSVILLINIGESPLELAQGGRTAKFGAGDAVMYDLAEPSVASASGQGISRLLSIQVERELLRPRLAGFEDRLMVPIPARSAALAVTRAYAQTLLGSADIGAGPNLTNLAGGHLADLVAEALAGAGEVGAEPTDGVRAARLAVIKREIEHRFVDPGFSLTVLAGRLGVTPRYVQALLAEIGSSFGNILTESRLQRAYGMLASRHHAQLSVSEIAFACGFSTVSHFHRMFRRRFAATPGDVRGLAED